MGVLMLLRLRGYLVGLILRFRGYEGLGGCGRFPARGLGGSYDFRHAIDYRGPGFRFDGPALGYGLGLEAGISNRAGRCWRLFFPPKPPRGFGRDCPAPLTAAPSLSPSNTFLCRSHCAHYPSNLGRVMGIAAGRVLANISQNNFSNGACNTNTPDIIFTPMVKALRRNRIPGKGISHERNQVRTAAH